METPGDEDLEALLGEQVAYYRAVAPEYEDGALPFPGGAEVSEALDAFRPAGNVLELACGPGIWTGQLLRHATDVTAVDGSPEMLACTRRRGRSSGGLDAGQPVEITLSERTVWADTRTRRICEVKPFWLKEGRLK